MYHVLLLTATLAGAAVATVIPTRIGTPIGSFSVEQVRSEKFAGKYGPLARARAYIKYGAPVPGDVQAAVARILSELGLDKRAKGSATTTPEQYDSEYLTPVSIGTPAQVLNLDFDTGSSDLWVFSSETPTSSRAGHSFYDPAKSSSSKKLSGATWSITYGDGSASSGDVYTDVVNIGGLSVKTQAVESAQKVSTSFAQDTNNDGLVGLAFSSINTVKPTKQKTFFDNAIPTLDAPLFTADLKAGKPGKYNFGYIDSSAYTAPLFNTTVDSSDGFWTFTSPAYSVGSGAKTSTAVTGIADTGTTLLLVPDSLVTAYYKQVSGAKYDSTNGGYVFPCTAKLPSFTYYIGSNKITIPGTYMNFAPTTSAGTTCYGGIQSDTGIGVSIYGDVALKAAFVVFNGGSQPSLGFAAKPL